MKPIIHVENLSKQYRLGNLGSGTLREDLQRWWASLQGRQDPFLKVGETNERSRSGNSPYAWALKNVSFDVMPGEVLGIIGRNGAGKSTLLKILSKVTGPTTGRIDYDGRIGSLLEVGTGFHPDLTGRENIFLNGAILGMSRHEIRGKLDQIIDFSGCQRYIDTPVKRYSSGMTVRLGFAVAAHLDPEILIVDEVLAVGDAEFQKKAIGKMQDVSRNQGRTVLFVSHNLGAVRSLCTKGLVLVNGQVQHHAAVEEAIGAYLGGGSPAPKIDGFTHRTGNGKARITGLEVCRPDGTPTEQVMAGSRISVAVQYEKKSEEQLHIIPGFSLANQFDQLVYSHHSRLNGLIFINLPKEGCFRFESEGLNLVPDVYTIHLSLVSNGEMLDGISNAGKLQIVNSNFYQSGEIPPASHTQVLIRANWLAE